MPGMNTARERKQIFVFSLAHLVLYSTSAFEDASNTVPTVKIILNRFAPVIPKSLPQCTMK